MNNKKKFLDNVIQDEFKDLSINLKYVRLYDDPSTEKSLRNMQRLINCMHIKIEELEDEVNRLKSKDCSPNPQYF